MKRNFVIRLPGDTESAIAKRTRRLRQEAQQEEEARERRATLRLVAKSAAQAILEGKTAGKVKHDVNGAILVSTPTALTDEEIRTAVEAAVVARKLKRTRTLEKAFGPSYAAKVLGESKEVRK